MMDSSERPHRTSSNSSTSELFVCFTSRFSSSSSTSSTMKISSKSILSPGRARDPPIALSTSLSRRLRTNGSLKGGQSPMFPTGGKKRGCAFENPEPSSPKVTCIGQVRVKTKKQGKRMRTLSKRRGGGEASFRKIEQSRDGLNNNPNQTTQNNHHQYQQQQQQECLPHRNQRWVHLPLTICEALRAFGAEFSCLFPCRSSCFSTGGREKDDKGTRSSEGNNDNDNNNGQSSCGAVFARWLVALQDGEGGKGREIELVVGGEDARRTESRETTLTRHVVEEMEIKHDGKLEGRDGAGEEDLEARVSICIPPKNALLLMRCRSDPMRMAALTNRFWDSPPPKSEEEEEDQGHDVDDDHEVVLEEDQGHDVEGEALNSETILEDKEVEGSEKVVSTEANEEEEEEEEEEENTEPELNSVKGIQEGEERENPEENLEIKGTQEGEKREIQEENLEINEELQEEEEKKQEPVVQEVNFAADAEENKVSDPTSEALADPEKLENEADAIMLIQEIGDKEEEEEEEEEEGVRVASHRSSSVISVDSDSENEEIETAALAEEATLGGGEDTEGKSAEEKETQERTLEETLIQETSESEETQKEDEAMESEKRESEVEKKQQEREKSNSVLPDCLLLMMCEPKVSMEVSKETWVCSTDFIRWIPERPPVNAAVDGGDVPKKRISTDSNPARYEPPLQQPPRSSCSFPQPAAVSMATMIEQKLVNAVAYEPFVLTRCKSEPMRTAAAKLAPDTCFWKNRKLEPLRRATFGLGAAGVGF